MKLSTKGRYAVTAMIDLAESSNPSRPLPLCEISERQYLPVQYLEQLFAKLKRADLVKSVRGYNGGYYLSQAAADISIAQIVDAVGEEIRATNCDEASELGCQGVKYKCAAHNLWSGLGHIMENYLKNISLEDVIARRVNPQGHVVPNSDLGSWPQVNNSC